jgi:hypothetical protein
MAITSIKTGSSFTNLQKYDTAIASNPPLMAAPTATDGGTGTTASVAFTTVTGATSYGVLSSPGSFTATGTSSPLTVSGLTSGTAYTFQVRGINSTSTGPYSAASNSVTPVSPSSFESIATFTGNGTASTYTFSSIPSTYKHLQIRYQWIGDVNATNDNLRMQWNGSTYAGYVSHILYGDGTNKGAASSVGNVEFPIGAYGVLGSTTYPCVGIIDIQNANVNGVYKTFRSISGSDKNGTTSVGTAGIELDSGFYDIYGGDTARISSITLKIGGGNFATGTTFALYGIKG